MDEKPFFEFSILDFKERDVEELKKFAKSSFDIETILTTANDLKYTRAIQTKFAELVANPTEDFVRLLSLELLGTKRFTPAVRDQFTAITKIAFEQFIGERINERLKGAMSPESVTVSDKSVVIANNENTAEIVQSIVTTSEELEGFHTVRAIVREIVPTKRVSMRDSQSYCAILLDDNNRKPICRLRFNNSQKFKLGFFNDQKEEVQVPLESVDDIYNYAEQIRATVASYVGNADS